MKVYTCTDHDGHWPVGVASIVVAKDKPQAKRLLDAELKMCGLKPYKDSKYTLTEISTDSSRVVILNDGNY